VPDWFRVLDKMDCVTLGSEGEDDRFVELLNKIWRLEEEIRQERNKREMGLEAGGDGAVKSAWDEHFHEPGPGWATEVQQARGGWWRCRDGKDAPPGEQACRNCHAESPTSSQDSPASTAPPTPWRRMRKSPPPSEFLIQQQKKHKQQKGQGSKATSADFLEALMGHVRTAMAVVAENDKKFVTAMMQLEQLDAGRRLDKAAR
jgi:hypothetical protein